MNVSTKLGEPIPVVQVKPEVKTSITVGKLIGGVGGLFLAGWLLMLIIPVVTPWELGYWQSVLLYIASNILFKRGTFLDRYSDLKGK